MTFKSNLRELKSYVRQAPSQNRAKVEQVINLYESKKIVNFKTAINLVLLLSSKNKNTINSGKQDREYNKIITKYSEAEPMTGRLNRQIEQRKRKLTTTGVQFNFVAFSEKPNPRKPIRKNGGSFYLTAGPNTMTLELPEDIPDKFKHTYVTRRLDCLNDELCNPNPEFDELLSLMMQNEEFSKWLGKVGMYLECSTYRDSNTLTLPSQMLIIFISSVKIKIFT